MRHSGEYLSAEAEDCWKESDGDVELVSGGSDLEKLRKNYSAFTNFWSGYETWSFLEIFRKIFGQKIEMFQN